MAGQDQSRDFEAHGEERHDSSGQDVSSGVGDAATPPTADDLAEELRLISEQLAQHGLTPLGTREMRMEISRLLELAADKEALWAERAGRAVKQPPAEAVERARRSAARALIEVRDRLGEPVDAETLALAGEDANDRASRSRRFRHLVRRRLRD